MRDLRQRLVTQSVQCLGGHYVVYYLSVACRVIFTAVDRVDAWTGPCQQHDGARDGSRRALEHRVPRKKKTQTEYRQYRRCSHVAAIKPTDHSNLIIRCIRCSAKDRTGGDRCTPRKRTEYSTSWKQLVPLRRFPCCSCWVWLEGWGRRDVKPFNINSRGDISTSRKYSQAAGIIPRC